MSNAEIQCQSERPRAPARECEVFRVAFDVSNSGMVLKTPDLRLSRVNSAFCEFLGRSEEELCGARVDDITHPEDLPATHRAVELLLRGELAKLHIEKQYRHASGRPVWGSVSLTVVRDVEGAPLYLVAHVQDITARKQAEAEIRRLAGQLLQAQKMDALGILASGVAHDFNNVLAAILANAELLQDMIAGDTEAAAVTRSITEAAGRGAELVRQILAFSRRTERRLAPTRLGAVVRQSLRMLRATLPASIELRTELDDTGLVSLADATQIQQLLTNLATNAWHAMPYGGDLSIELSPVLVDAATARATPNLREGAYARLRVTDTGVGMDEETLRQIFEPFFTTKPAGKGTGLGLSLVYNIVHEHGGALRVTSARGRGTMFEIYLPTVQERAVQGAAEVAQPRPGTGARLLVVDDEPALVQVLSQLLTRLGYAVRGTSSQEEALALCRGEHFDLALVDFNMPHMNGVELGRRLHASRPGLPLVMMSGFAAQLESSELADLDVREVLQKPIARVELADKIRLVLQRRDGESS